MSPPSICILKGRPYSLWGSGLQYRQTVWCVLQTFLKPLFPPLSELSLHPEVCLKRNSKQPSMISQRLLLALPFIIHPLGMGIGGGCAPDPCRRPCFLSLNFKGVQVGRSLGKSGGGQQNHPLQTPQCWRKTSMMQMMNSRFSHAYRYLSQFLQKVRSSWTLGTNVIFNYISGCSGFGVNSLKA